MRIVSRAEEFDAAAKRLRAYRHSLHPPTPDSLRAEIAAEDREWDSIYQKFIENQEKQLNDLFERHKVQREKCDLKWGTSIKLDRMRKREQILALSKRFKEAAEMKERGDALQLKLALQALGEHQRDEIQVLGERRQQGIAFIEVERGKTATRLNRLIAHAERKRVRVGESRERSVRRHI
jgi:hypothetical protein